MYKRSLHIAIAAAFFLISLSALAQKELGKSRLNVGQTPKKTTSSTNTLLNVKSFNSKVNLTTAVNSYYRDRLINKTDKSLSKTTLSPNQEKIQEKITFGSIYPNPASQFAYIDYTINRPFKKANITFYNLFGNSVGNFEISNSSEKLKVNVSGWTAGIYMYQINIDGIKITTKKLLVNRN